MCSESSSNKTPLNGSSFNPTFSAFLALKPISNVLQRLREPTESGYIMTQSRLQKLKRSASCGPASKPSHDASPSGRPDTPPPGHGRGPRPLFSIPVAPPRAYYTRKMDKAVERLETLKYAVCRDSDSRERVAQEEMDGLTSSSALKYAESRDSDSRERAAQEEIDGLTSSSTPSSPPISSVGEKPTSPDDIDATDKFDSADIFEVLLIVDEAKVPSLRAKELSHHNGETVTKEPPPTDINRTINDGIGQLTDLYDWAKHHTLKHKNKRVSLRLETLDANNQVNSPSCPPQNSPNGISTPCDLTFGILGPPAYKPPNQPIETPAPNDVSTNGKQKARPDMQQKTPATKPPAPIKKSLWCHQPPLPQSNLCTSRLCPVLPRHRLGFYLHKNTKRTRPEIYFGDSNPPPIVWFAVDLMAKGEANWRDEEMIAEFIKLHYFVAKDEK